VYVISDVTIETYRCYGYEMEVTGRCNACLLATILLSQRASGFSCNPISIALVEKYRETQTGFSFKVRMILS